MTRGRKRDKFKRWWTSSFSVSKGEIHRTPEGSEHPGVSSPNIHIDNSIHVSGTGHVVTRQDGQGNQSLTSQIMGLVRKHIIPGAAHDASARDPPPRCHPQTRVKLLAKITAWFNGEAQEELLLWLTGPAGVGKSAIVQTFAEDLAKNSLLGASVFISRPNRRNNPHGIFITIAYQLATRIEAYRNYITERLSIDPDLLSGGMAAQFATFIVEPFVEKKVGAGGKRWAILLDGLDELDGQVAQCEIIQLVTAFAHEHRDAPLAWIIASRPEPHISNAFEDDINKSHWSEYIPIDSNDACKDVERFLRSSFEKTQKQYRQSVPNNWPSDNEFLKITVAASGLFVYAQVVTQFIIDPTESDPYSRLELLVSVIDRSKAVPTTENPFVQLDALYKEILSLVPLRLWPSTKRLFGYIIHAGHIYEHFYDVYVLRRSLRALRGLGLLFGLSPYEISACLLKCHSTIRVPDWKVAHQETITVLHASFADFLRDPVRSCNFYVGNATDVKNEAASRVFEIWSECSRGTDPVESKFRQYCLLCDETTSNAIQKFDANFFRDIVDYMRGLVYHYNKKGELALYEQLCEVDMIRLCYVFEAHDVKEVVENLMNRGTRIDNTQLVRRIPLKNLEFGNLNWEEMSPACARQRTGPDILIGNLILDRPRSSVELTKFVSELESLRERSAELEVVIFGAESKGRVTAFCVKSEDEEPCYYIIPYAG